MIPVTAAGGVLYRIREGDSPPKAEVEVLLIYRNGVWDLPKGKKEAGETIEECARREVAEEVGIPRPESECYLAETYHEYEQDGKSFGKTTHWYRMRTDDRQTFTPQRQEGIEKVAWAAAEEACRRVGYDNLVEVLDAFTQSLQ